MLSFTAMLLFAALFMASQAQHASEAKRQIVIQIQQSVIGAGERTGDKLVQPAVKVVDMLDKAAVQSPENSTVPVRAAKAK